MTNRNVTSYSFKSVGTKVSSTTEDDANQPKPPIGIKTPLELTRGNGLFKMHTELDKQVSDNFRNLIQTNHGERLGFYDYGANLGPILFDLGSEDGDTEAMRRISVATQKWMKFIQLDGMQIFVDRHDNQHTAKIGVRISYTVAAINDSLRIMELILYMGG